MRKGKSNVGRLIGNISTSPPPTSPVLNNSVYRVGTGQESTDRDGEADQRGRRDFQDQKAEQNRGRTCDRDGGRATASPDTYTGSSAVQRTTAGTGTGGTSAKTDHFEVTLDFEFSSDQSGIERNHVHVTISSELANPFVRPFRNKCDEIGRTSFPR